MYFMHRLSNDKVLNLIHLYVTHRLSYETLGTNSTFSSACNVSDLAILWRVAKHNFNLLT